MTDWPNTEARALHEALVEAMQKLAQSPHLTDKQCLAIVIAVLSSVLVQVSKSATIKREHLLQSLERAWDDHDQRG